MKYGLLILLLSSVSFADCYERYYSNDHLSRYQGQELRDVQLSWEPGWQMATRFELLVHLVRAGKHRVGKVSGLCDNAPVDRIWGDPVPQKTVTCQLDDNRGTLTIKASSSHDVLAILSPGARLVDHSKNAQAGQELKLTNGDRKFGLNFSRYRGNHSCLEVLDEVHTSTLPRLWNEMILFSIRHDLARPTVTARNLYHMSALLWDVYAAHLPNRPRHYLQINHSLPNTRNLNESISYAAYAFLKHRYKLAPGNTGDSFPDVDAPDGEPDMTIDHALEKVMWKLGHSSDMSDPTKLSEAAQFGLKMAQSVIDLNIDDGSRERENYAARESDVSNPNNGLFLDYTQSGIRLPIIYDWESDTFSGGGLVAKDYDIDHWVPLYVPGALDQNGNGASPHQLPLTLFWGQLPTFGDLTSYLSPTLPGVYFDPSVELPKFASEREKLIRANLDVAFKSQWLNPIKLSGQDFDDDGVADVNPGAEMIDISPRVMGNNDLGTNNGKGYATNPISGLPYEQYNVRAADFYRSIAEFWADGPDSETPPGHWNTIANYALDRMDELNHSYRWRGQQLLQREEFELRLYLTLNGALHDAAVVAWGIKGHFQGNRPISVLRKLADMAERDSAFAQELVGYSPDLKMVKYMAKWIDDEGQEHEEVRNKLAIRAWRGHMYIGGDFDGGDPDRRDMSFRSRNDTASAEDQFYDREGIGGVGWILVDNWMPYQAQNFVTPPFPGFVSGHSTFSRAAAEVLAFATGSQYFPGGLGTYPAPPLKFEYPEIEPFHFQWATYFDASDQSGVSRIYGGIHADYDDLPARRIGSKVGKQAAKRARAFFQ